jgi:hypothetical protein
VVAGVLLEASVEQAVMAAALERVAPQAGQGEHRNTVAVAEAQDRLALAGCQYSAGVEGQQEILPAVLMA